MLSVFLSESAGIPSQLRPRTQRQRADGWLCLVRAILAALCFDVTQLGGRAAAAGIAVQGRVTESGAPQPPEIVLARLQTDEVFSAAQRDMHGYHLYGSKQFCSISCHDGAGGR